MKKHADVEHTEGPLTTRRHVLTLFAAATVFGGCNGSGSSPAVFGDVQAGNVKDVAVGSLAQVGSEPVILGRDDAGLYALTNTCTHQGCDVEPVGSGTSARIQCPCHGSRFDRNGAVTHGPAASPLAHFAVDVDTSGNITIHGGKPVSASARTAVTA